MIAAGGAAAAMRTADEWRASEPGRAVASVPLVDLVRLDDAPPLRLPAGDRPLSGIRVIELTHVIAGPVCGRVLAAHGADVLHIGAPHLPTVPPLVVDTGFGKRSAHLDLRTSERCARLRELIAEADVFVQSYRPDSLLRRGFGVRELTSQRPGLVVVDLSAYGWPGPWAGRRGFDSLVQLATGIADEGARRAGVGHPVPLPAQVLDHATGWLAAGAVMTVLHRRGTEGGSWRVRLALARTAAWLGSLGRTAFAGDLRDVDPSQFGPVSHVLMPGRLPGAAPRWAAGPHRPGSDPPAWW